MKKTSTNRSAILLLAVMLCMLSCSKNNGEEGPDPKPDPDPALEETATVFIGTTASTDNRLYALDAATGTEKWSFKLAGSEASCAVYNGVVYQSGGNAFYALDAATGTEKWSVTDITGVGCPTISEGVLYFSSSRQLRLYAFDAASGEKKWDFQMKHSSESSPVVSGGVVYAGSGTTLENGGGLYAVDAATGQQKWGLFTFRFPVYARPTVSGETVYVINNGFLVEFDTGTGTMKGYVTIEGTSYSSPMLTGGAWYVGGGSNLYALDAVTLQQKWVFKTGVGISSSPTVSDGVVYVGSHDKNLYAVDAATGQQKWVFPTGDIVVSSPVVSQGVVYVGSHDGNVYAVDAPTGKEKWVFKTAQGARVPSSPVVLQTDGTVAYPGISGNHP